MAYVLDESKNALSICPRAERSSAVIVPGAVFVDEVTLEPVRAIVQEPSADLWAYLSQDVAEGLTPQYGYHFWWGTDGNETEFFRLVGLEVTLESLSPTGAGNPFASVMTLTLAPGDPHQ
ncbi:MAG: hypothetical protein F4Z08_08850 [Chloroflexi bacterium]|nr:hypothetical protein [Chloroflexota bacterium]